MLKKPSTFPFFATLITMALMATFLTFSQGCRTVDTKTPDQVERSVARFGIIADSAVGVLNEFDPEGMTAILQGVDATLHLVLKTDSLEYDTILDAAGKVGLKIEKRETRAAVRAVLGAYRLMRIDYGGPGIALRNQYSRELLLEAQRIVHTYLGEEEQVASRAVASSVQL